MMYEGFCDLLVDPTFDSTSTDFSFYDSSWSGDNLDGFSTMADQPSSQLYTWKSKPITSWTSNEILHWMCNEATNNSRSYDKIKMRNFANISIDTFQDMGLDDFIRLSESCEDGELLYRSKENLVSTYQPEHIRNRTDIPPAEPQNVSEQRPLAPPRSTSQSSTTKTRRVGRPSSGNVVKRKSEKSMGKLWEFLRNLLLDDKTCPSLIKWDNHKEGTFKFVQSEKVAKLWGDRKKNDKMNYEKLSRAMRYYYRSRVLLPVAGKRLVYKFGEAATGWRTDTPILDG